MKTVKCILCILVILCLVGCGNTNNENRPTMNIDYVKNSDGTTTIVKNGSVQYFFTVDEGDTIEVIMSFEKVRGSIDVYVAKDSVKENAAYTGQDLRSGSFSVIVSEAGTYQIYYTCKDFVGEYTYELVKK